MKRFCVYENELTMTQYERLCEALYSQDRSMIEIRMMGQQPWFRNETMENVKLKIRVHVKDFNGKIGELLTKKYGFELKGEASA